ncbi:MAG TPA: histidine kinase, partial [Pyrinomonadaceae bacterium]|nr:histidine kinase [Pyrinomonadaceae bacterium]
MKKTFTIFLHCGYWLIYFLLLMLIFALANLQIKRNFSFQTIFPLIVLCLVPQLFAFYGFYFLLFTRFLAKKRYFLLTIFGISVCLLTAFFSVLLSALIFGFGQPIFNQSSEFFSLFTTMFLIAAIHGGIALVIKGFVSWFEETKLKEELAQKNYQTEIALIKSQINPHFLFNTINNIDVLISKDAAKASNYLNKFSDILRYTVYETRSEKIVLSKELNYIEKYLELQKIR